MTEEQQKFVEICEEYEALKELMKEKKQQITVLLEKIGVGNMFQDTQGIVYKVTSPKGTFVEYAKIGYDRTKKVGEFKGTLSKKEAENAGFKI